MLNFCRLLIIIVFADFVFGDAGELDFPRGIFRTNLPAGSVDAPSYNVLSPGVKGKVVFRGQVKLVNGNNVQFHRVPDLTDPTVLSWPFKDGILASLKARAKAFLDSNKSLDRIEILFGGAGYSSEPDVSLASPTEGSESWVDNELAFATATISSGIVTSVDLDSNYSGKGYAKAPEVMIEGGVHFIRCVEGGSPYSGKFFLIVSNTGDTLSLNNPLNYDLSSIFKINSLVEVFEGWTLGSLFGYNDTQLMEGNSSTADLVYLLKSQVDQNGTSSDYVPYYHNGSRWDRVGFYDINASETIIYPDESFIIARRSSPGLELKITGIANTQNSFVQIPASGKRALMNNPFAVDTMLSDLIPSPNLTDDLNHTKKWFVSSNQEKADNINILNKGVWTTYWHDGTNKGVTKPAFLTARRGTGVAASITQADLSMSSGVITAMTNPHTGSIVVTSPNHSLKRGFTVKISNAYGYKTNSALPVKSLIDENGNEVSSINDSILIYSSANGFHEVGNVPSPNTFELLNKSGNCMFTGEANWTTGDGGSGYTENAFVSFIGGGGQGAYGIANVVSGRVQSITITQSGYGYTSAPKVFVHSGGWRRLGAGNSPFNDELVPAGSGVLLTRNHEYGEPSLLRVENPILRN